MADASSSVSVLLCGALGWQKREGGREKEGRKEGREKEGRREQFCDLNKWEKAL